MTHSKKRRFSTRRGRPPLLRGKSDRGTPELQEKRGLGITQEPIDHLYQQGLISTDMHQCALHFRWLYTLRFGSPSVKALNHSEYLGIEHRPCSTTWDQAREEEYRQAALALDSANCLSAVLRIAVFNAPSVGDERAQCLYGLQLLVSLWRRGH